MKPILMMGSAAYSPFRLDALRAALAAADKALANVSIDARWVYAIDPEGEGPDAETLERAALLLNAENGEWGTGNGERGAFYVTPRKGTISPWSSKATDIFRNCGLKGIARVERGIRYCITSDGSGKSAASPNQQPLGEAALSPLQNNKAIAALYDRMTEGVYTDLDDLFDCPPPKPGVTFDVLGRGVEAIREANVSLGLAISEPEMQYLADSFKAAGRNPTDTELVMFGQVNSEHCRHKIFGAQFIIDGKKQKDSLFGMIKNTHKKNGKGTLVAYKDNSSVVEGFTTEVFGTSPGNSGISGNSGNSGKSGILGGAPYSFRKLQLDQLMKVETHNHPTAISPYPGAATGVGGEIRDEAATGSGSRSNAGICGFMVSDLHIPGYPQPWEREYAEFPKRLATPLAIMAEGPIGGAAFGNEFGRPQLTGFFRTYEGVAAGLYRGYHKPIMLAGGHGVIIRDQVEKKPVKTGAYIVQIGGPAMRIGLGGGAASSMMTGTNDEALDFNSVQRGNAEMQRRCQGVINACASMGHKNPVLSIHDIGAGGLSNGCPELVEATGGKFSLRTVHNEEPSMNPMEIWCCEAQERYVLALKREARAWFEELCARERCPVAFIGEATGDGRLILEDEYFHDRPIDMDIKVLLGKPPRMVRDVTHVARAHEPLKLAGVQPQDAFFRLLHLPTIADKTFLVTITDRSVTGLVARDQMVGPYQLPAADCAVTAMGYKTLHGQAMATGERTPVALIDAPASGRLAIAEALTNLAAADCGDIHNVRLSANWMAPCGEPGEDANLYDTVKAVGMEFCPALGISIPVGKDSCSMHTTWTDSKGLAHKQVAPLSLVVSSFSPVENVQRTLTPDLKKGASKLIYVDLGQAKYRLGGSCLAQVYNQLGDENADADAKLLKAFFNAMQKIVKGGLALAYHDRSDGGLAVTLAEMAITGGQGIDVTLPDSAPQPRGSGALAASPLDPLAVLFSEEPGAVLQVADEKLNEVLAIFRRARLGDCVHVIGAPTGDRAFTIHVGCRRILATDITSIRRAWSETTYRMQALRDNPATAKEEYDNGLDETDPGLTFKLTYEPDAGISGKSGKSGKTGKPRMAILREQGVNGHIEMAAAFALAGFESVDVHMTDLLAGRVDLADFQGLVACGGFSYGDVLGAGSGWARSILFNRRLKAMFKKFFHRKDTFSLGVCNGCQMLSQLKDIIPGAEAWPEFKRNTSEQFEARYCTLEVLDSPSIFFKGMAGSRIPIAVAHGEGRVVFPTGVDAAKAKAALRYVDGRGQATERYPWNPNGSAGGLTSFTTRDGRATIMMPHPERGFRAAQLSYNPGVFTGEAGPWMRMFRNAYNFAVSQG
ncbi:MAG: phosphoribosylformylglycinamidine synthase [Kiritimatiellae bacterium]|nr:phosphoribosylformylglycinamidine synthase [Kiritimatiellia bacterium]